MIREAIDFILELKRPEKITDLLGREYIYNNQRYVPVELSLGAPVNFTTLEGIIDFAQQQSDDHFLHVRDYKTVRLTGQLLNEWGTRRIAAESNMFERHDFEFRRNMGIETFIINLRSKFIMTEELTDLLDFVSNISQSSVNSADDDGVSQTVVTKNSITMRHERTAFNGRCKLRPYRTFSEVEQPEIECYLRLTQQDKGLPLVALYEADGGEWKNQAVANIKQFLRAKTKDIDIIG